MKENLIYFDEFMAEDVIIHVASMGNLKGRKNFKLMNSREGGTLAFPDFKTTINDLVS